MNHPLDAVARSVFSAALAEDRCGELLDCLLNGGSATVDIRTGVLILLQPDALAQLVGHSEGRTDVS